MSLCGTNGPEDLRFRAAAGIVPEESKKKVPATDTNINLQEKH